MSTIGVSRFDEAKRSRYPISTSYRLGILIYNKEYIYAPISKDLDHEDKPVHINHIVGPLCHATQVDH